MEKKDYNKMNLWTFIMSDRKHIVGLLLPLLVSIFMFIAAFISDDLGNGKYYIMGGSIVWFFLFVYDKWTILKKMRD